MSSPDTRKAGATGWDAALAGAMRRIAAARTPLVVSALVVAGFWFVAGIPPAAALIGLAAIAVAVLAAVPATAPAPGEARVGVGAETAEPMAGYAAVADGLPDPCYLIDADGLVRFENRAAVKLFGSIDIGRPITFLLRAPEVGEAIRGALTSGTQASVTFFERVPADRWFEARVSPLGEPGAQAGEAVVFLVLLRDLTEAQRVERMRVDFVANASHELRTPLASLTGFIETLQGPARNDPVARDRFLDVMYVQARRMSRLIDDLMSLSRIELKAHVRPETTVDVAPILEHVADAMHPLAIDSGVELKVDIAGRPLLVTGDRDELAQVFQNLVHNAIKYGQSGGRVALTGRLLPAGGGQPARVSVAVRDWGAGIEAEHIPRLTERFYRVDTASSREKGGTGLGLAIVKHILNRHRGQLLIESKPGAGAVFTVQLDAAVAAPESVNPQRGGKKK